MVSTTKLSSRRAFGWLWFGLFLAQAALPLAAWGQTTGPIQWIREISSGATDGASGVAVDPSGVYVAGSTSGTLPGQTYAGNLDAFVRKYDANGNEVWTRQFGTAGGDGARGIAVDPSGIYVAGFTGGVLPGQTSAGFADAFVRKFSLDGTTVLWTQQFGTPTTDGAADIAVDPTGVYVAGSTLGVLPGQNNAGIVDAFVRKFSLDGTTVLWTQQFGTPTTDGAADIAVDPTGVYVAGGTEGALPGQNNAGIGDAFVRKYDASGNEVWTRQFGSTSVDQARGIAVDPSGIYVAGFTGGVLPGQTSAGDADAFVRKYDAIGNELWTRQFGTPTGDEAADIAVDLSGIYVTGTTSGDLPGQTSLPVIVGGNVPGRSDAFVRYYDASGNELRTWQFQTATRDNAFGIAVDASGVYVAGETAVDTPVLFPGGNSVAFVRKLGPVLFLSP